MKFSDYVVLGSTIVELEPDVWLEENRGCLIGMAVAAKTGMTSMIGPQLADVFPWLFEWHAVDCPVCGTGYPGYAETISCVSDHVFCKTWSFEQALEYIRSVEPQEEVHRPIRKFRLKEVTAA